MNFCPYRGKLIQNFSEETEAFSLHPLSTRKLPPFVRFVLDFLLIALLYFLVEVLAYQLLGSPEWTGLAFGGFWSLLLASLVLILPRKAGRIVFGISYFIILLWALAQAGYYAVFQKMMWLSTIQYAGEGATFLGDVLSSFGWKWWVGSALMISFGVLTILKFPQSTLRLHWRLPYLGIAAISVAGLFVTPELIFLRDNAIWGTHSEYARSSSYQATYETMYNAKSVFNICGIYQMTARDIAVNELYPLTPAYRKQILAEAGEITEYFNKRPEKQKNKMTGTFAGKNVVLVLMESMDDWMITPEDTPTIYSMMEEGINFTNFYTPGYGSARTLNTEFCINTGIYLPTTGTYVFDYVTNHFNQSFAFQMKDNGYSPEVFHYNDPSFYSRGVFEPAMGYNAYNCYADYEQDEDRLYDDCLLFDIPQMMDLFFREGKTFNTIITRSAHLSYVYNEVLSHYALKQYPEYRGMFASEEENCARVKAKLVDDMFARLLKELDANGQLENTVIIGVTDHYTYGYKNLEELYAHSGVSDELLLEKTPCFVWSTDCPDMDVTKTLNTSDFLPTMLNLLGIDSPYHYLGQDAFDPDYVGYALFPDGSWICQGIACKTVAGSVPEVLFNENNLVLTDESLAEMAELINSYIRISNLLLTSDYYKTVR